MALQIILPRAARPKYRCRVPTDEGGVCGEGFGEHERRAFEQHVIACATRNEDAVQAERPSRKVPVMYDREFWDPEYEDHMRKVGRRMVREGRMETKPHER